MISNNAAMWSREPVDEKRSRSRTTPNHAKIALWVKKSQENSQAAGLMHEKNDA